MVEGDGPCFGSTRAEPLAGAQLRGRGERGPGRGRVAHARPRTVRRSGIRRSDRRRPTWRPPAAARTRRRSQRGLGVPALSSGRGHRGRRLDQPRQRPDIVVRRSMDGARTCGATRASWAAASSRSMCDDRSLDGLVGLAASGRTVHLAWSDGPQGRLRASRTRCACARRGMAAGRGGSARTREHAAHVRLAGAGGARRALLMTLQRPDGGVRRRALDGYRSHLHGAGVRAVRRPALGARGRPAAGRRRRAWLVYADIALRGDDVADQPDPVPRLSTTSGGPGGSRTDVVGTAARLRQATNLAAKRVAPGGRLPVRQGGRLHVGHRGGPRQVTGAARPG